MVERKVVGRAQQGLALLRREVGQSGHPCSHRGRVVAQEDRVPKHAQGEVQVPLGGLLVRPCPRFDITVASNMALMVQGSISFVDSPTWRSRHTECPSSRVDAQETQICNSMSR